MVDINGIRETLTNLIAAGNVTSVAPHNRKVVIEAEVHAVNCDDDDIFVDSVEEIVLDFDDDYVPDISTSVAQGPSSTNHLN